MYGKLRICNRALGKVGNYVIQSLEDPSEAARLLKESYDTVRDTELAAYRWGFAIARKLLPALEEAPLFGYARAYQLPPDCLRVLEVGARWPQPVSHAFRSGENARWQVEGDKMLSNMPAPLPLLYIRRAENPERYPAEFVEALAAKLAVEICERLSGGQSRKETLWGEYERAVKEARRVNAIQRAPQALQDGAWMHSRRQPADGGFWSSTGEW